MVQSSTDTMSIDLNCGIAIPALGLGTYTYPNDDETIKSTIHMALKVGYRLFDTASIYGSELAVGHALTKAVLDQTIKREDVFVTSKMWCSDHHDPVSALKRTLRNLNMEYLDMYLVHWPAKFKPWASYMIPKEEDFDQLDLETTWTGMEKCFELGLCRGIGVSNFTCKKIKQLLEFASITPAMNQVEMHPLWRQKKLREVCADHKINISAYSPLGRPGDSWGSMAVLDNPVIQSIALKHNATPAQVAIQWGLSMGASVVVKTFNQDRLKENMASLNLKLDDQDLLEIDKLEERKIARGWFLLNDTTSPYKTYEELWDGEI